MPKKIYSRICNCCGKNYTGYGEKFCSYKCSNTSNKTNAQRFWSKVNITDLFDCWEWTGAKNSNGYGQILFNNRDMGAHRVSYLLNNGTIDNNLYVLHKCNNPLCVNPAHLYLGTPQDNMNDKLKAGRQRSKSIVSENQVKEIIALLKTNMTQNKIAKIFSVSRGLIRDINTMRTWKHIPRN